LGLGGYWVGDELVGGVWGWRFGLFFGAALGAVTYVGLFVSQLRTEIRAARDRMNEAPHE
jgi:hypothetical protein